MNLNLITTNNEYNNKTYFIHIKKNDIKKEKTINT